MIKIIPAEYRRALSLAIARGPVITAIDIITTSQTDVDAYQDGVYENVEKAIRLLPDQYKKVEATWHSWEL